MNRIVLINRHRAPDRKELVTCERRTGELLFAEFPELSFAGYVICENKLAANWIVPPAIMGKFTTFVKKLTSEKYGFALFADGTNWTGGQEETRIV